MTTVALIPSFKPNDTLFNILEELRCRGVDRVVVDDGSGMEYRSLFRRATHDAVVLSYAMNHGKGYALKLGMRYIEEHYPADAVVVTVLCAASWETRSRGWCTASPRARG